MLNKKISLLLLPLVATLSLQANDPFNDPFFKDPFGDNIFKEMMRMQEEMDKMFERMHQRMQQRTTRQIAPLGTYKIPQQNQFVEKGDGYEYKTNIPENKENQIDVHVKDGLLSITAKIIEKHENKTANAYSSSSSMRMYQQTIPLPNDADASTLQMGYKDGYLVINVQKKKEANRLKNDAKKEQTKKLDNTIPKNEVENREKNSTKKQIKVTDDSSMS